MTLANDKTVYVLVAAIGAGTGGVGSVAVNIFNPPRPFPFTSQDWEKAEKKIDQRITTQCEAVKHRVKQLESHEQNYVTNAVFEQQQVSIEQVQLNHAFLRTLVLEHQLDDVRHGLGE